MQSRLYLVYYNVTRCYKMFEHILAIFLCCWANFHCSKYWRSNLAIWPSGHTGLQLFNTALTYLEQHLICEVCVPVGSCSLPMLDYWDLCRKEFNTKLNNRYKEKFPPCCILSSVTSVTVKLQNYAVISSGNTAFYLRRHHRVLSVTVKLQNCAVITSGSADTKWIECDCIKSLPKIKLRNCLMQ